VTLERSNTSGEELQLKGSYLVASEDDTFDSGGAETTLSVASLDMSDVRDLSGNLADSDNVDGDVKSLSSNVVVDTIVPEIDQVLFHTQENALKFVFNELLDQSSLADSVEILEGLNNVTDVTEVSNTSTTITIGFAEGVTFNQSDTISLGIDFSVKDLAGNIAEIPSEQVDDIV